MDLLKTENVEKLFRFYVDNALNLATMSGVEADAELKIRIIPNKDKNIEAKFVIIGSGRVLIPGQEEELAHLSDTPDDVAKEEAEVAKDKKEDTTETMEAEIVQAPDKKIKRVK